MECLDMEVPMLGSCIPNLARGEDEGFSFLPIVLPLVLQGFSSCRGF